MSYKTTITWEALRSFNSASLTGGYDLIGTPLLHPAYNLRFVNSSDKNVTISIDGATDIDVCPANTSVVYNEYKTIAREGIPKGTQFYVKGTAGTGTLYVVVQYIKTA